MSEFTPQPQSGWDIPFPPEKPRVDAPAAQQQANPAVYHTAGAVAWGSGGAAPYGAQPTTAGGDFRDENRRLLDGRRVGAYLIDLLVLLPVAIAFMNLFGLRRPTEFIWSALALMYFFLQEALTGQTIGKRAMGLRVWNIDGTPATANAVAGRTVLRILDAYLIGLLVMVCTGGRRQRIGDLMAGTVVRRDDRPFTPAPRSPLLTVYPLLWLGAATAVALHLGLLHKPIDLHSKRTADPFMAQVDQVCERRVGAERSMTRPETFQDALYFSRWETSQIAALRPAPRLSRTAYRTVLRSKRKLDRMAAGVIADVERSRDPQGTFALEKRRLRDAAVVASRRFEELGLPYCAQ